MPSRGVARGGAEGAVAPPEFGRSVNPIQTRGADYAPHTTASPPDSKSYPHLYTVGRTQGTRTTRSTDYLHLSPVKVIPGTYYHVAVLFFTTKLLEQHAFSLPLFSS